MLSGSVDYAMYKDFRQQFEPVIDQDVVVIELSTLGGDPEVARMMGEDIRYYSEMNPDKRYVFLGKAAIYSAGTTFMSFFTRANRYLTRGTRLMIHERKMDKHLHPRTADHLSGCCEGDAERIGDVDHHSERGFANLILGSSVTMEEVLKRAPSNWYLEAEEARTLGLIEAVL